MVLGTVLHRAGNGMIQSIVFIARVFCLFSGWAVALALGRALAEGLPFDVAQETGHGGMARSHRHIQLPAFGGAHWE
jgi:hypothetical protein